MTPPMTHSTLQQPHAAEPKLHSTPNSVIPEGSVDAR